MELNCTAHEVDGANMSGYHGNVTVMEHVDDRPLLVIVAGSILLSLIIIISILGNAAVIYAIMTNSYLREQASNLFLINLCLTDFSSALFVMTSSLIAIAQDLHFVDQTWCNLMCSTNYCFIIVSMMTLGYISVDRFLAVSYPLKYYVLVTKEKVAIVIVSTWVQGLAFGIAPALAQWVHYDYWEGVCAIQWHLEGTRGPIDYVISAFCICFLFPSVIMVVCYTVTIRQARKNLQAIIPQSGRTKSQQLIKHGKSKSMKTIWSLVAVVIIFFFCMTLFSVTKLIKVLIKDDTFIPPYINLAASYFAYIASMSNPFIYGIFRSDFRRAYKKLFFKVTGRKWKVSTFENSDLVSRARGTTGSSPKDEPTADNQTERKPCGNGNSQVSSSSAEHIEIQPGPSQHCEMDTNSIENCNMDQIVEASPSHNVEHSAVNFFTASTDSESDAQNERETQIQVFSVSKHLNTHGVRLKPLKQRSIYLHEAQEHSV